MRKIAEHIAGACRAGEPLVLVAVAESKDSTPRKAGTLMLVSADGLVCGHIHHAEMRTIDGILYCNDGDWVESLTALIEHPNGELAIVDWSRVMAGKADAWPAPRELERTAAQ